jgi:hypothetical protein
LATNQRGWQGLVAFVLVVLIGTLGESVSGAYKGKMVKQKNVPRPWSQRFIGTGKGYGDQYPSLKWAGTG